MSTNKSHILNIAKRVLFLAEKYTTDKAFIEACGLNHSFLSHLRGNMFKNISGDNILKIVIGTGCNAHWLITGEGTIYAPKTRENKAAQVSEPTPQELMNEAENLFDELEAAAASGDILQLSPGVRIQLLELLVKDEKQRSKNS